MTRPRLLSLFSGYGGLDMAVAGLLDADLIAHAEIEPAARRVLAHRFPGVPNLGDVSAVDWSTVGPVDVITGGFPCQDVSLAGRRLGIRHDTRSGLWAHMAAAVDQLRPSLVIIENVRGLLSARAHHPAHSDLEPCPWCLAGPDDVSLRALGAVLGDLSDLGYDAAWRLLSASDVGAPHGRARVFIVARPADTEDDGRAPFITSRSEPQRTGVARDHWSAENADRAVGGERWFAAPREAGCRGAWADAGGRGRASAADASGDGWDERRTEPARLVGGPHAPVCGAPDAHPDGHPVWQQPVAVSGGGGPSVAGVARPDADRWGPYGTAVRRWEFVLGRPAPAPTESSARGSRRLSPRFVEWMMGLPAGWVTSVPGITRNEALRLLGNGVVPQQAQAAVGWLLAQDSTAPPASVDVGGAA
jgi:DNA (cytosine-5)-methyltransferase 1